MARPRPTWATGLVLRARDYSKSALCYIPGVEHICIPERFCNLRMTMCECERVLRRLRQHYLVRELCALCRSLSKQSQALGLILIHARMARTC